ncbi:nuclear transport factor 2 family protein [Ramlibacter pallidus]|uniref:Nuclear transport factor 2 family protein n=1 Tax=Ramlibacter pallidus TaxID=2780087 RepID=A0ABR9S615_9BURK|nr:nuclear transport factor 2 family protein [Ramlibacter pallidus]MBE7368945.1 nuclear transport factor 2 family protein [Ramlibacter pallidus]
MHPPLRDTRAIIDRFNEAFQRHATELLTDLVAEDCVLENTVSAPDGDRYTGRDACLGLWQSIASDPQSRFEVEEVRVLGDHGLIFWRYWPGASPAASVRGLNVMRIAHGRIVEGRGYVKQAAGGARR